jgi:glycosyltransferase involved in cell wall biosynthesis
MRVLLLDQFSEMGGAQRGLLEASEGFAARGWELHAAIPDGPLAERLRPLCASVSTIPCGPFQSVRKTAADAMRFASQLSGQASTIGGIVEARRIDALYVNGPRVVPAAIWARRGRPVVFHSHSVVTQPGAARFAGEALRWSGAHVLTSSRFVSSWLSHYVTPERLRVIYNGIRDPEAFLRPRLRYTRIGVLGRIAPEKGQVTFARAARIAVEVNPELTFIIAGAPVFGNADYEVQVRREAGSRVSFTGWTENIGEFFAQIDLLGVPSEGVDANPRVIPEAYAAGVPVIAFDSGGVGELLEHGKTGILVRERSSRALAEAMLEAVRQPEELNRLAANAYQRWQERYTLPRFQSEVCEALERAVAPVQMARARASA